MRAFVYPADVYGCGYYRLIWPGQVLASAGYDAINVMPEDRQMRVLTEGDHVTDVLIEPGVDVVVFQRITHVLLAQVVSILRAKGIAVVVDVDDDLRAIHPSNPAWFQIHPRNEGNPVPEKGYRPHPHSWHHLDTACRDATLVTVSTPTLADRYAGHGRYRVLYNALPDHHYDAAARYDSANADLGWPASLHSHPDDPQVVGPALARLVAQGATFRTVGDPRDVGRAFGLGDDPPGDIIEFADWPQALTTIGVGITPLSDTRFNSAKSWLKPLELAGAGVPWVGSPRLEYRRLHEEGCGVLAERPKEWYRTLQRLLRDESRRRELSEAGREVAARHRIADHAWRWWEAWSDAVELERSGKAGAPRRDRVVVGATPAPQVARQATPFQIPLGVQPA